MTVTTFAYAKINLFLDIESRRADGYHNILSFIELYAAHKPEGFAKSFDRAI